MGKVIVVKNRTEPLFNPIQDQLKTPNFRCFFIPNQKLKYSYNYLLKLYDYPIKLEDYVIKLCIYIIKFRMIESVNP